MSGKRIVTLGEVMLRLKAPDYNRLMQSPLLEASFGGSAANVAVSLAQFGANVVHVTALPRNPLGESCLRFLRAAGVDTSRVVRQGERMGLYFFETGVSQRPARVLYDRAHSAMTEARAEDFDWDAIFEDVGWLHVSGITASLSANSAELTHHALRAARAQGITTSLDVNYRNKLWQYGKSPIEVMPALVEQVDLLIANETDCRLSLGLALDLGERSGIARLQEMGRQLMTAYPTLRWQALFERQTLTASHHQVRGCLFDGDGVVVSRCYDIAPIVDRVGTGDAFAAGLIFGLASDWTAVHSVEFAAAAGCLKHTISGDVNWISAEEVEQLLANDGGVRVQR